MIRPESTPEPRHLSKMDSLFILWLKKDLVTATEKARGGLVVVLAPAEWSKIVPDGG